MKQISFTVSGMEEAQKILSVLHGWEGITNLQIKEMDAQQTDNILPAKKRAASVEEMLADWSDMHETTESFRQKLWKTPSF
ncbi:MAG: hypothetical protein PHX39_10060 [Bacteroidales bacterium]|jgi:hypothetical protein|nr:hypothetical protein [Bacteroidales bacterium]